MPFLACRVFNKDKIESRLVSMELDDLSPGEVVIRISYSGVNYKDALATTGRGKILRKFPLNAGIDLAGIVESSTDPRFKQGDSVLVNGCGLGESHDGGFAQYAKVPADWVIALPEGLSLKESMILGTAGFTAALAIQRMQENGLSPEQGEVVVTGASGGVGSHGISILKQLGYQVIAVSGRQEMTGYLQALGADKVLSSEQLELGNKPLEKAKFAGVIDNAGGELLTRLIAHTHLWGNVASIGLASGPELKATVFPFILRGVSLLGISSTNCPMPLRRNIWQNLSRNFKPKNMEAMVCKKVTLEQITDMFHPLLDRKLHGRVLVDCS